MKTAVLGAVLAMAFAGAAQADPVYGDWRTTPDDNGNTGIIRIAACGERICGTLVKSFDASGAEMASANTGKRIIWDMQPQGSGAYGKGKVWVPDRDKTYSSKMQLNGDKLAISGCILVVCRDGGTWTRVN